MANPLRIRAWQDGSAALERSSAVAESNAFESLVDAHYRRVYTLALRILNSPQDAQDVTQEVFLRAYRALPRLRADGAQAAWIRRIATNLCLDTLRRRKSAVPTVSLDAPLTDDSEAHSAREIADEKLDPARILDQEERRAQVLRALENLPDDYRTVVVLHHLEDLRVEDIAEIVGVPTGTVKSRLSRARKALKRRLSPYFDPDMSGELPPMRRG